MVRYKLYLVIALAVCMAVGYALGSLTHSTVNAGAAGYEGNTYITHHPDGHIIYVWKWARAIDVEEVKPMKVYRISYSEGTFEEKTIAQKK